MFRGVALITIALIALSGCDSSSGNADVDSQQVRTYASFPELGSGSEPQDFPESELIGRVFFESGCTYVEDEFNRFIPVFSESRTSWDASLESLMVDEVSLTNGASVRFSGGEVARSDDFNVPDSCEDIAFFIVGSASPAP